MARKIQLSTRRPSFFKALKGDFSRELRIPSTFIKNLNRCSMQVYRLRGPSGQCWDVELDKRGPRLFFHKGWEDFVKYHPLEVGDFLIFSYDGVSMFKVTIYGKTLCEKNVTAAKRGSESNGFAAVRSDSRADKKRAVDHVEETPIPFQSENPFVCRTLRQHTLFGVRIPMEVVKKHGYRAGMTLKIKDAFGNSWVVGLGGKSLMMRLGLSKVFKKHKTSPGDTVIFEFVKPRVVQFQIIKAGA